MPHTPGAAFLTSSCSPPQPTMASSEEDAFPSYGLLLPLTSRRTLGACAEDPCHQQSGQAAAEAREQVTGFVAHLVEGTQVREGESRPANRPEAASHEDSVHSWLPQLVIGSESRSTSGSMKATTSRAARGRPSSLGRRRALTWPTASGSSIWGLGRCARSGETWRRTLMRLVM